MTPRGRTVNPGGWRTAIQPTVTHPAPSSPPKKQKERAPIPAALSKPAPLWLACPFCKLPQLATAERVLLWHRMEWRGQQVECTGTNTLGLPLSEAAQ